MLVTSIFSFSHYVSYHFQHKSLLLSHIHFLHHKWFQFGQVQTLLVSMGEFRHLIQRLLKTVVYKKHFLLFPQCYLPFQRPMRSSGVYIFITSTINTFNKLNPLLHMLVLGFSNSTANKDVMTTIWKNEDTII